MSQTISQKLSDLDEEGFLAEVRAALQGGTPPGDILDACRAGMILVGKRHEDGEYFVSDLIMAGEMFKEATGLLGGLLEAADRPTKSTVVVGTVAGDVHDIGKDLVVAMLRASGFKVIDLGVNVPPDTFVESARDSGASVVALSGLLTVGYGAMKETVEALRTAGLPARVMIGGGPVNETVVTYTGADAFGKDAQSAVTLAEQWTQAPEAV